MKIKLVAYGVARDIINQKTIDFELSGSTVSDLRQALFAQYPEFEKLNSMRFAVNDMYKEEDELIQAEDEVILIPPVSGG